jgi:hypothetical protein
VHIRNVGRRASSLVAGFAAVSTIVGLSLYAGPATASFADGGGLAAPSILSPTSGTVSSSPTVAINGTAAAGASVGVLDGGVLVGTATADLTTGDWSTVLDLLQSNTAHSLTAEQTVSGQTSPQTSPVLVTVTSNQVVVNGSFEQPDVSQCTNTTGQECHSNWANYSYNLVPGWNPTNNCGIELQTNQLGLSTSYQGGNQYAELDSNCVSGVTQTVATVPGAEYILSFAYQARPYTAASENTMAVQWNGSYLVGSAQAGSGLQDPFGSWATKEYAVTATSSTTVLEFDSTNPVSTDSLGAFLDGVSLIPDAVYDPNKSWLTAQTLPTPGLTTQQAIDFQGEALWYDFPVSPGQQLQITLSSVPADYNIAVFSDISQAFSALTSSTLNLAALGAEAPGNAASPSAFSPSAFSPSAFSPSAFSPSAFSPSAFSPSAFSPSAFSPSAFSPSAFSPSAFSTAYSGAQLDSLLAVSTTPGAVTKSVTVDTWNNTGNFYVRITGNNGAFAPFMPYTLTVTSNGGPCQGVVLNSYSTDSTISGAGGPTYGTVIVTNSSLMPNVSSIYTGTNPMNPALQQLAAATNGTIVDVAGSQMVMDLQAQAAANPGCPYAPDLTAAAIQNIINSYRTTPTSLQNVVIVGDGDVIPFFRYPDNAGLAGESNYQPPLLTTSSPDAALANNYYLSDDQYGAANQLTIQGVTVPLATAAVGRLVETPTDILATINSYLGGASTINPTSSVSTGYDFMAPPASQIATAFSSGIGGSNNSTLINNTWSATDLQNALFNSHHDLAFLGGHFSANNLLAADETTTMTTNQFASQVGNTLQNSLVLGAGCHSGYNIDPTDAIPGVTDTLDWPQAFAEAGSTLIAGTGYQYGDTNYVAYSDQLYVDIAQQLGYQPSGGAGPVPVGLAMLTAKQKYLSGVVQLNGIEEKALLETTLYGLPMIGVQEPHQVAAPGGLTSSVSAGPVASNPGALLGLQEGDVNFGNGPLAFNLTPTTITPAGSNTTYSYDSGAQGVTAAPGGPVLPVQTYDVNVANGTLRGVGFFGGSYTDQAGTNPLTGDPATETGNPQVVPFASPVFFPQTGWNPNYFGTLLNGGDTELALTPVQYISGASGDTMRTYSNEDLRLFYSNNTQKYGSNIPALAAPPSISNVTSTISGSTITFSANVTGDPSAGIQDVWVTYTGLTPGDPNYGQWQSLDLSQNGTDTTLWSNFLSFTSPADTVFIVQAVNGVGEVSMDNNNGYYFTPGVTPGAPLPSTANTYSLALGGDTTGTYLGTANVTATMTGIAPNAGGSVANRAITFTLGPTTVAATTNSLGVATARIPLIEPPGTYSLAASYAGDGNNQPAATLGSMQINQAPTALTLSSPAQITSGTNSGATATLTSGGSPLAQKPVYFVVSQSGSVVGTALGITNSSGIAQAGPITTNAGAVGPGYTLTAYFGSGTTPLPNGGSYNASDPDYVASTSSGAPVGLVDATQTSLNAAPSPAVFGQSITLTATVSTSGANGSASPPNGDGTVAFYQGGSAIAACANQPISSGQATCTVNGLVVGPYSFSATYSGDTGSYLGSSSLSVPDAVNKASTQTSLTAPKTSNFGSPVTLTAQVQPVAPGAGTPTGTVIFYAGTNIVGSAPLNAGTPDTATVTVNGLAGSSQSFSARYAGDSSFAGSTSNAVTDTFVFTKTYGSYTGNITVGTGQTVLITGKITGSVSVSSGGSLEINGGTVTKNVSANGAAEFIMCGATVGGALSVSNSTGYAFIGGGTGASSIGTTCAPSSITGSVSLSGNLDGVEIATTKVGGNVSVTNNSGYGPVQQNGAFPPTEVAGNAITGSLACSNNLPTVTDAGQKNTASSTSGQCGAVGF